MSLKKTLVSVAFVLATALSAAAAMTGDISVITREQGSGTRGAFIELFGIEQKDASGKKVDLTSDDCDITNSTAVMMTSVAGNPGAMGYISLGSLNDTVKALKVDGVEATAENIEKGEYKAARPFVIVTKGDLSNEAKAFLTFINSAEGQGVIEKNGYIAVVNNAPKFKGGSLSGKVVVAGSSSVTPIMEKLKEAYLVVNPSANIEVQQSDSTTGVNAAISGICDLGMSSRELKDSEKAKGATPTVIAMDGIALIVNKNNPLDNISKQMVCDIYTGAVTKWEDIK